MNHTFVAGHLGADPEVRFTPSGQKVINLRIASNVRKGGQEDTMWWRVTMWGEQWDKMLPYLKKGSAIMVWGEMKPPQKYVDRNGETQISLEITADRVVFPPFGRKGDGTESGEPVASFGEQTYSVPTPRSQQASLQTATGAGRNMTMDPSVDDIPF